MFKLIKKLNKKQVLLILISVVLIFVQVMLDLKLPDYMSNIIELLQTSASSKDVLIEGFKMLLCAFGSLTLAIIVGYFISYIAAIFSKNLRKSIFEKVINFTATNVKKFSVGSLITRTTNDVTQIEMLLAMGLQLMVKSPITVVFAVIKILNKNWQWSAVIGSCVIIMLITIGIIMSLVLPKFKIVQKLIDKINSITTEHITGIRVIRAFNAQKYQENKFEKVNNELTKTQLFNQRMFGIMQPMMYIIMYFSTLLIYFIGAFMINNSPVLSDKITLFGNMIVFSSYGMQVIMSFLMLAMIFIMLPRASISASRINEVLDSENDIISGIKTLSNNIKGEVEFKNVSFKYEDADEYVLENISFKSKKGQTIAFIGSTGSGKSTLINLIPRFYDATCGEILIDGVNIKDYKIEDLNDKIGYIPQKAVIFSDTIENNILYGLKNNKPISKDNLQKASNISQSKEFIEKMDKKYKSMLAQRGTNLSGGQKQRISIARAIARDAEFYIFDDSFSALDYKTDLKLRLELKKECKDATVFIVAQRIGTIINADEIIVLDKGKCVGKGTHKQLLKSCKVYKEIALSQLNKEELENA